VNEGGQIVIKKYEIEALRFFETSGSSNPEDMIPQNENWFATNKIFQLCVISSG
jgi:hypothetical protein